MRLAGVPANQSVKPPEELKQPNWISPLGEQGSTPRLQPYQETVAFLCRLNLPPFLTVLSPTSPPMSCSLTSPLPLRSQAHHTLSPALPQLFRP